MIQGASVVRIGEGSPIGEDTVQRHSPESFSYKQGESLMNVTWRKKLTYHLDKTKRESLEISWVPGSLTPGDGNYEIRLNGSLIAEFVNQDTARRGGIFCLPDGRQLRLHIGGTPRPIAMLDGKPIPGSYDPAACHQKGVLFHYLVAMSSVVAGWAIHTGLVPFSHSKHPALLFLCLGLGFAALGLLSAFNRVFFTRIAALLCVLQSALLICFYPESFVLAPLTIHIGLLYWFREVVIAQEILNDITTPWIERSSVSPAYSHDSLNVPPGGTSKVALSAIQSDKAQLSQLVQSNVFY